MSTLTPTTTISEMTEGAEPEQVQFEKAVAKVITEKQEQFGDARKASSLMVKANISYLSGHQNIAIVNGSIVPLPSEYETEVTMNRILPAVTNDIAVGTKSEPTYECIPNSSDENDKRTALMCTPLIKHLQRINGKDLKRKAAILWFDLAGVSWRKVWVDPTHNIGQDPETGQAIFGPEVMVDLVPNHELVMDTRVKDVHKHKWMIHVTPKTISDIAGEYGEEIASLIPKKDYRDLDSDLSEYEVEIMGDFINTSNVMLPNDNHGVNEEGFPRDKQVERLEYWQKPTAEMPSGVFAVMVGNVLIHAGPYPIEAYPHGELPFIGASPLQLDGVTQQSVSRISQARPIQRYYNKFLSMIADNLDAMGNSVIFSHSSNELTYSKLSNKASNIIEFSGLQKPVRESGIQVPSAIFAFVEKLEQMMDEIFAFHEPSRGIRPTGVDSAKGLQLLQDADFTQLAPVVKALDESDEKLVYQAVTCQMANYGNRIVALLGDDMLWTQYDIKPEELTGKVSITIRTGSSMPMNKAVEADKAYTVWQSGLLGDPNDPQVRQWTLSRMDLGNIELITKMHAKQVNYAKKEFAVGIAQARQMPPIPGGMDQEQIAAWLAPWVFIPPVTPIDNHSVHIVEHQEDILSFHMEAMGSGNIALESVLQVMKLHLGDHLAIVSQQQQAQQMQAMQAEAFTKGNTLEQIKAKQLADLLSVMVDEKKVELDYKAKMATANNSTGAK
jgi:hypothetical protein